VALSDKVETSQNVVVTAGAVGAEDFDGNEVGVFCDTKGGGGRSTRAVGTVTVSVKFLIVESETKFGSIIEIDVFGTVKDMRSVVSFDALMQTFHELTRYQYQQHRYQLQHLGSRRKCT